MLKRSTQKTACAVPTICKNECDKIIEARATESRRLLAAKRQRSIAEATASYKTYMTSLDAYVKKVERQSDLQYRRFLLGAASHRTVTKPSESIHFTSKVYHEHKECLRKEIGNNEF